MPPKKKSAKKIPVLETVHFRPGNLVGSAISSAATHHEVSRGEMAKRLVALALHGFDMRYYPMVEEISECYVTSFDNACSVVNNLIEQRVGEIAVEDEKRLSTVIELVREHRRLRGLDVEEEIPPQRIRVYLTGS